MQSILSARFIVTFVLIGVASTAVSALLFGPHGLLEWIGGFFFAMTPLRLIGMATTLLAATGISYAVARLGADPVALGLVPVGAGYTYGRRLATDPATGKRVATLRTADDALDDLDAMIGLSAVKYESTNCSPASKLSGGGASKICRSRPAAAIWFLPARPASAKPSWHARSATSIARWAYCAKAS